MTAPKDPVLPLAPPSDPRRRVFPGSVRQRRVEGRGGALGGNTGRRGWGSACHGGKDYDIGCHFCVDGDGVQREILGGSVGKERKFGMSKPAAWLVSVYAVFRREGILLLKVEGVGVVSIIDATRRRDRRLSGWGKGDGPVDNWRRDTDTELRPVDADAEEFALGALGAQVSKEKL
eukprot:scaffold2327_cov96-Cylindrotheca_fusiformis.AAC.1